MKITNRMISITLAIFLLLGFMSLMINTSFGGCSYADINLTITRVDPPGTQVDFICNGLEVNGEQYGFAEEYEITGNTHPSSTFGRSDLKIVGVTNNDVTYSVEGYTRYNSSGMIQNFSAASSGFIWIFVLLLLVAKIIIRSKRKSIKLNP